MTFFLFHLLLHPLPHINDAWIHTYNARSRDHTHTRTHYLRRGPGWSLHHAWASHSLAVLGHFSSERSRQVRDSVSRYSTNDFNRRTAYHKMLDNWHTRNDLMRPTHLSALGHTHTHIYLWPHVSMHINNICRQWVWFLLVNHFSDHVIKVSNRSICLLAVVFFIDASSIQFHSLVRFIVCVRERETRERQRGSET